MLCSRISVWTALFGIVATSAFAGDHRFGVWNIENLSPTGKRGFPELKGTKQHNPREPADLARIAEYIREDLAMDALIVTEIHADIGTSEKPRSSQLDVILTKLGSQWEYFLGRTGGKLRVGIVYNADRVKLKKIVNLSADEFLVQGKDVFDRDPLIFWIALLDGQDEMNDLFLVGLHLKSQQKFVHNHMAAMARLVGDLAENDVRTDLGLPKKGEEQDVIILGDLNDSAHRKTGFTYIFDYLQGAGYVHLGSDLDRYPSTRVNGSQIDHIFVSEELYATAIDPDTFNVYVVPKAERAEYRKIFSDHFPVTVDLTAYEDDD